MLAASDFLTVEVWTSRGLVTHYLLFVISLADRVVNIAGITTRPDESWMLQIAHNETDSAAGALHSKRYLIIDRDTKYLIVPRTTQATYGEAHRHARLGGTLNFYYRKAA